MAYLVVNSRYNPFSYDELVKPLVDYTNEYNRQEEAYNKLLEDASAVESFINEDNANQSWGMYSKFMNDLRANADDLATNGLSPEVRRRLQQSNSAYRTQVTPIITAINRRQEAIKAFEASPAGKSGNYIGRKPSDTSVDDWLNGNTPDTFGVNGQDVSDYVKDEVAAASERNYMLFKQNGYNITKVGASQEETAQLIRALRSGAMFDGNTQQGAYLNSVLDDLRNNVIKNAKSAFGFENFVTYDADGNPMETADTSKFMDAVYHGIMSGMKGQVKQETNQYDLAAYNHSLRNQEAILNAMLSSGRYTVDSNGKVVEVPLQDNLNEGESMRQDLSDYIGAKSMEHQKYTSLQSGMASPIHIDANGQVVPVELPDGSIATDMLQVYRNYKKLEDKKKEIQKKYSAPGIAETYRTQETQELLKEFDAEIAKIDSQMQEYKDTFGERLLSDRDYRKLKDLYGFTNDNFTLSDIYDVANQSRDYFSYQYADTIIADKGGSPDLLKDIHQSIVDEITERGTLSLRKTDNGIDPAKNAALSEHEKDRLLKEITRVTINPEGLLDGRVDGGYIVVTVPAETTNGTTAKGGEAFRVLVPTSYLLASAYDKAMAGRASYLDYIGKPLVGDRTILDKSINNVATAIRGAYNNNISGRKGEGSAKLR